MHAIRQHAFGGPLTPCATRRCPTPSPRRGRSASRWRRRGAPDRHQDPLGRPGRPLPVPDLPMTPGGEVAGRVDRVGPEVDAAWIGRRVVAHLGWPAAATPSRRWPRGPRSTSCPTTWAPRWRWRPSARAGRRRASSSWRSSGERRGARHRRGRRVRRLLVQAGAWRAAMWWAWRAAPPRSAWCSTSAPTSPSTTASPAGPTRCGPNWATGRPPVTVLLDGVGGEAGRAALDLVGPGGRVVVFGWSAGSPLALTSDDLYARSLTVSFALGPRIMQRPGGCASSRTRRSTRRRPDA